LLALKGFVCRYWELPSFHLDLQHAHPLGSQHVHLLVSLHGLMGCLGCLGCTTMGSFGEVVEAAVATLLFVASGWQTSASEAQAFFGDESSRSAPPWRAKCWASGQ